MLSSTKSTKPILDITPTIPQNYIEIHKPPIANRCNAQTKMKWHCFVFFLVSFFGHGAIVANEYEKFCKTSRRATNTNSHAMALKCHLPRALVISLTLQSARPTHLRSNEFAWPQACKKGIPDSVTFSKSQKRSFKFHTIDDRPRDVVQLYQSKGHDNITASTVMQLI